MDYNKVEYSKSRGKKEVIIIQDSASLVVVVNDVMVLFQFFFREP